MLFLILFLSHRSQLLVEGFQFFNLKVTESLPGYSTIEAELIDYLPI